MYYVHKESQCEEKWLAWLVCYQMCFYMTDTAILNLVMTDLISNTFLHYDFSDI